jgi:hypothetical protein
MLSNKSQYWIFTLVVLAIVSLQNDKPANRSPSLIFGTIRERFEEQARMLNKLTARGPEGSQEVFAVDEVNDLLQQTKMLSLQAIPVDDAPLRRYVERRFPDPLAPDRGPFVGGPDVIHLVDGAKDLLNKLATLSNFRFDLSVHSQPSRARFDLIPPIGPPLRLTTDDKLTNIYRGEYTYEIRMSNHKTIRDNINFIDRSGTILYCQLQLASTSDEILPCSLK